MPVVAPVPANVFEDGDLLDDVKPEDLVYFLLNVGDGDTQLVLLPAAEGEARQAIVVDVIKAAKFEGLRNCLISRHPRGSGKPSRSSSHPTHTRTT
jgi:hypothetical protein